MQFCAPSRLYFSIAIFVAVIALFSQIPLMLISLMLLFSFIWAYFLDFLCGRGYKSLSWFFVLLPYALKIIAFVR